MRNEHEHTANKPNHPNRPNYNGERARFAKSLEGPSAPSPKMRSQHDMTAEDRSAGVDRTHASLTQNSSRHTQQANHQGLVNATDVKRHANAPGVQGIQNKPRPSAQLPEPSI